MKRVVGLLTFLFVVLQLNSVSFSKSLPNTALPNLNNHQKPSSQPVCFTQNKGQWNPAFQFIGNTPFGQIGFGQDGIYYHLISAEKKQNHVLKLSLVNADMSNMQGVDPLSYPYNYFIGNDSNHWITNVPNFSKIQYKDVYPGIDLVYFYEKETPKYEFYVNPGINPNQIQFKVEGGTLSVSEDLNTLHINTSSGAVSDTNLKVFTKETNHPIQASFHLADGNTYSFHLSQTYFQEEIVIDPLLFGTYFSGSSDDNILSQDIDSQGNLIVTGFTKSFDFPLTPGSYDDGSLYDVTAAFVAKFNSDLSIPFFSTFLQGAYFIDDPNTRSYGCEVRVDTADNIIVTGITYCTNFPVTDDAYDRDFNGFKDIFISKLSSSGTQLLYSTYLGGNGEELIEDLTAFTWNPVALAPDGSVYIAINTDSTDFPLTEGSYSDVGPNYFGWDNHIAICHLSHDGSSLLASTFFGGSDIDYRPSLALDEEGNLLITGCTRSTDMPVTTGALMSYLPAGMVGVFVSKLSGDLKNLLFCTYLAPFDFAYNAFIDVGLDNSLYITASCELFSGGGPYSTPEEPSPDSFVEPLDIQPITNTNSLGIFVFHIDENGSILLDNTILDGLSFDAVNDTSIDSSGFLYLTGFTFSDDFPMTNDAFFYYPFTFYGDIFVTRLYPDLSDLSFSTYLVGFGFDCATDILITDENIVYSAGYTSTSDYFFVYEMNGGFDHSYHPGLTGYICAFTIPLLFPPNPSLFPTPQTKAFRFDWTEPSPGTYPIAGYALYRSLNGEPFSKIPFQILNGNGNISTTDVNLPDAQSYHYALRAFDIKGNFSGFSSIFDYYPPSAPMGASAISSEGGIKVSWTGSIPGTAALSQYLLFRSDNSNFATASQIASVAFPTKTYTDTTAVVGKTYYYAVKVADIFGFQSLLSNICSGSAVITSPVLVLSTDILKKEFSDNDYINFKAYVYNLGGIQATNVLLTLHLPELINFVSITGASISTSNGNNISFLMGSIPKGSFKSVDFICQINGKVDKEEKVSIGLSVICDQKVEAETSLDFIVKIKKNNKGTIGITISVTNLEQDPDTGKRFIRVGEALIISYNISGGVPPYKLTIDWGDGTSTTITIDKYGNMSGTISHKYDTRGKVHIRMKLEDSSGQSKDSDFDLEIR